MIIKEEKRMFLLFQMMGDLMNLYSTLEREGENRYAGKNADL
jgi:hypothetical protein